jgi:hypothetical protein
MKFNLNKAKSLGLKLPKQPYEKYNEEQLLKGIKIEKEHFDDEEICVIISANHLDEIPDYYTRLEKMENEVKGLDENIVRISLLVD